MNAEPTEPEELVARWIELRERGEAPPPREYARAHPALEKRLVAALEALAGIERVLPERVADLPERVGRFDVLGELGRGGMGRVLRVRDPADPGVELALKQIDTRTDGAAGERALRRFLREGEVLRALAHPGIVPVREVGASGARPYLVMELVPGESLAARIARAREHPAARGRAPAEALELPGEGPAWTRIAGIVARLSRAVAALHRAGLVHRDLKPANVLLTPAGAPVLVDFGLAHHDDAESLTRTGDLVGTPQYMSPEQARGERLDDRADVWGLGAVLYELLTLRPPHAGGDPVRVLESVRSKPITPLRRLAPDVPRDLARVVERALAHHRRHRTSSAELVAADLESFLAGRRVSAGPPSLGERAARIMTFHRRALATLVLAALLVAIALPLEGARRGRVEARDREHFERAVTAWVGDRADDARTELAALDGSSGYASWAGFLRAVLDDVDAPGSDEPAIADAASGWNKARAGDSRAALVELRAAAERAPRLVLPVLLLARTAERAGELRSAAAEYTAAARLLPECAELHARLAELRYELRLLDDALASARRALELAPRHAPTWHLLAKIHSRRKEPVEGLAAARRAVELAGAAATREMRNTLGVLLDTNELHDEAQAHFRRMVDEDPRDARPYFNLAFSYDKSHRVRDARDTYLEVARVGDRARALASLAWLHAGNGRDTCAGCRTAYEEDPSLLDPERAEQYALEALAVDEPWDPGVPSTVAQVALRIGRKEQIRAGLKRLQAREERDDRLAACARALRMLD